MNKSKSDSHLLNSQTILFKPLKQTSFICNDYAPFTKNGPCRFCLKPNCQTIKKIKKKKDNSAMKSDLESKTNYWKTIFPWMY